MLLLLHRFAKSNRWSVDVLHINHGIREESSRDQSFVRGLAEKLELPFRCEHPVHTESGSVESRWSTVRQGIYRNQPGFVAVAHSASDRAETILFRLIEGAGLRGLGGMDYKGVGPVRRPMLDMHSREIRTWLKGKGQGWMEDSSNRDTAISRNRLRRRVMPVLEDGFPEAVRGICRSGTLLSRWRDLQDQIADLVVKDCISRSELLDMPGILGVLVLWQMAERPRNGFEEFQKVFVWLSRGGRGKHILPGGKRLVAEDELIRVETRGSGRY
jgi:tRNA(Ile)-lysidine synthase